MTRTLALLTVLAVGCGGGSPGGASIDAPPGSIDAPPGSIDAPPGSFALTSPMLANNGNFNAANTCNGVNTSPQLSWTGALAGTLSYAIVLTDMSINLVHWVIYDIPPTSEVPASIQTTYAPGNVPGAHQTVGLSGTRGYRGPCPPVEHTYQFVVYALDAATLPGATMATTKDEAITIIMAHDLGAATLTGKYKQP